MANRVAEFQVGLVVLLAIVVLIVGVIWLTEAQVGDNAMYIQVAFDSAGGIMEGDPVRVSGVKRGKVDAIELGDREVQLLLALHEDVVLYSDATFKITNFGIMGEMQVAVSPGSGGPLLDPGIVHPGVFQTDLTTAMKEAGPILEDVRSILGKLDNLLDEEQLSGSLRETVDNMRQVTGEIDSLLVENRDDLSEAVTSSRSAAEGLDRLVNDHSDEVDSAISDLAATSSRLNNLSGRLEGVAGSLEKILASVEAGEGTLGKLATDEKLYDELLEAVGNMNLLLVDVRKNPKRYVKIEVF